MSDVGFGPGNLPYGVFRRGREQPRLGARLHDRIIDLPLLARSADLGVDAGALDQPALNPLMELGSDAWARLRARLRELVDAGDEGAGVPLADAELRLPFQVADYVDFYSSLQHALNLGRLFRPDAEPLLPNWRHLPIGYHGRAGTVVVSGTEVRRPSGQRRGPDAEAPEFGPSLRLDIELELGYVVGAPSRHGTPVSVGEARGHLFGVVLVNDWSARDLQAWEYQPLGPFLGKSFATSISAWVVPMAALEPFQVEGEPQDPQPLPYLRTSPRLPGIDLEVGLRPAGGEETATIARTNAANVYWDVAQQLAHATSNGAGLRAGDLLATGTISGPRREQRGSLIELSWNGEEPVDVGSGQRRTFLEDGDEIVLRGLAQRDGLEPVALGEVSGRIAAAGEAGP